MTKKPKVKTPDWIIAGYESEEAYMKAKGKKVPKKGTKKVFKLRLCPKCGSDEVSVSLGKEKGKEWTCKKCKWAGTNIKEKNVTEDEFMEYLDKKGESLPDETELKKDFKKTIESSDSEDLGDD